MKRRTVMTTLTRTPWRERNTTDTAIGMVAVSCCVSSVIPGKVVMSGDDYVVTCGSGQGIKLLFE